MKRNRIFLTVFAVIFSIIAISVKKTRAAENVVKVDRSKSVIMSKSNTRSTIIVDPDTPDQNVIQDLIISKTPKDPTVELMSKSGANVSSLKQVPWINDADVIQTKDAAFNESTVSELYNKFVHDKTYMNNNIMLTKVKPTDSFKLKFTNQGIYQGGTVDAILNFSNIKTNVGEKNYNHNVGDDEAMITFSSAMFDGYYYVGIRSMQIDVTFVKHGTETPVSFDNNAFLTFNSLNGWQSMGPTTNTDTSTGMSESATYINKDSTSNTYITKDSMLVNATNKFNGIANSWGSWNNTFDDTLGSDSFSRGSVQYQIKGSTLQFVVGANDNRSDLYFGKGYASRAWNTWSTATLFNVKPTTPVKKVTDSEGTDMNNETVLPDTTLNYSVQQKVNTLGVDILSKYKTFTIKDPLPKQVQYVDAKMLDSKGNKIGDGTTKFDQATNTVMYEFSNDYLQNKMLYDGETYKLVITVKSKDTDKKVDFDNTGTVTINSNPAVTNKVINHEEPYTKSSIDKWVED